MHIWLIVHRKFNWFSPGVNLNEVELSLIVEQKLNSAGVGVAHVLGEADGALGHAVSHLGGEVGRGGHLHHLLVTALHRAVALVKVHHVARIVTWN